MPSGRWPGRSSPSSTDEAAAAAAERHFERLLVERGVPDEVEEHAFSPANGTVHLPLLLAEAFGISSSEGRRLIAQGAIKLDGVPLRPDRLDLPPERLEGVVLQIGKRRFKRLRRAG